MMIAKKLIIIFTFCLLSFNITAQISSGKTTYKFNNAPILSIESITFADENQNKEIDGGEKCFLILSIRNSGKSIAKSVNLNVNSNDLFQAYLSIEKTIPVGNIPNGETKVIKIPFVAANIFNDTTVIFEFIAREANNYDSKLKTYQLDIKAANTSIAINWYYPAAAESNVNLKTYTLKACINSQIPVTDFSITQNKVLSVLDQNRALKKTDNCNYYLEHEIKLEKGNNQIQIFANNRKLKAESEIRNIILTEVQFEHRMALIIGNSKYETAPLRNPANDAKSMAKTLRELNFDVIEIIDGDILTIRKGIREFHAMLSKNKGIGLLYYAGHGVQVKGENYIIPINHDIQEEYEVSDKAVRVNSILDAMESTGTRMNIVILDACRDNPFARNMRSTQRGLAQVYAEGSGSIIAYATSPGSVAADGDGQNGLYTQELLKAIKTPGLEIGMVFRAVLTNVKLISDGKQLPWTNSSIEGEFYFLK